MARDDADDANDPRHARIVGAAARACRPSCRVAIGHTP
jgi:hypothetical protein